MQGQIASWKYKYADIKQHNENEITELDKKYENNISDDAHEAYKKQENYKQTIEEQDNTIWKLKQEGDLHQKQIYELNNELKFRVDNVKNCEDKLSTIIKEINNEKEIMLQDELRHDNTKKEYQNNQNDMKNLQDQILNDL